MRDRKHKILGEGVEEREGQAVVIELSEQTVEREIAQAVVHPAHIPFEVEAETAEIDRFRHHRPGGALLGYHHDVAVLAEYSLIELFYKCHGFEILSPAVGVRTPFAVLTPVVEIEHGRNGIDPQPVRMVDLEPKQRARHQEALNLRPAVVKNASAPLLVLALVRVGVFVACLSVKFVETERVLRKVRRNPVQYNSYAAFVAFINKIHKVVRSAVTRGRREVSGDLISP